MLYLLPQADDELASRFSEQSELLERSIRSMDARAQELHACAERACTFFAGISAELEAHEEKKAIIDEAGEQRVRAPNKPAAVRRVEPSAGSPRHVVHPTQRNAHAASSRVSCYWMVCCRGLILF